MNKCSRVQGGEASRGPILGEAQDAEKVFARKLGEAGWYTFREEDSGRIVTNAHLWERDKLEKLSGLACEVVREPLSEGTCARIGPKLVNG